MACADFPSTGLVPGVTTHVVGDVTYRWDGTVWESIIGPLDINQVSGVANRSALAGNAVFASTADFATGTSLDGVLSDATLLSLVGTTTRSSVNNEDYYIYLSTSSKNSQGYVEGVDAYQIRSPLDVWACRVASKCLTISMKDIVNLNNLYNGKLFYITDKFGGSFWKYNQTPRVVDSESSTNITFTDERVLSAGSGYLVFDSNLNNGKVFELNSQNYAKYISSVYGRDFAVNINCYGDSITYGQALPSTPNSTNKIGSPTGYGDGGTFNHWQFDNNWPTVLQSTLNKYVKTGFVVNNRGYSGARCYSGYLMHRNPPNSGVSVIAYGVNEVLFATGNGADETQINTSSLDGVEAYSEAVRKFAIREVLRGNTVVLMSTTPFKGSAGWDSTVLAASKVNRAYDKALKAIADEFGFLYIDPKKDIFYGHTLSVVMQDGVHPNEIGHAIVGKTLSSLFVGGFKDVLAVSDGSKIIANPVNSNVFAGGIDGVNTLPNSGSYTPPFRQSQPETVSIQNTLPIVFTFYAEEDDLIVYPEMECGSGTSFTVTLSDDIRQPEYLFDGAIGKAVSSGGASDYPQSSISKSSIPLTTRYSQNNQPLWDSDSMFIHIAKRGYYTITISNDGGGSVLVDGLSFLSYESAKRRLNDVAVVFDGGNPSSIIKSIGVSSVTRVSTGLYDINLTYEAPDSNYIISGTAMESNIGSGVRLFVSLQAGSDGEITTNKARVEVCDQNGNRVDAEKVRVSIKHII